MNDERSYSQLLWRLPPPTELIRAPKWGGIEPAAPQQDPSEGRPKERKPGRMRCAAGLAWWCLTQTQEEPTQCQSYCLLKNKWLNKKIGKKWSETFTPIHLFGFTADFEAVHVPSRHCDAAVVLRVPFSLLGNTDQMRNYQVSFKKPFAYAWFHPLTCSVSQELWSIDGSEGGSNMQDRKNSVGWWYCQSKLRILCGVEPPTHACSCSGNSLEHLIAFSTTLRPSSYWPSRN